MQAAACAPLTLQIEHCLVVRWLCCGSFSRLTAFRFHIPVNHTLTAILGAWECPSTFCFLRRCTCFPVLFSGQVLEAQCHVLIGNSKFLEANATQVGPAHMHCISLFPHQNLLLGVRVSTTAALQALWRRRPSFFIHFTVQKDLMPTSELIEQGYSHTGLTACPHHFCYGGLFLPNAVLNEPMKEPEQAQTTN